MCTILHLRPSATDYLPQYDFRCREKNLGTEHFLTCIVDHFAIKQNLVTHGTSHSIHLYTISESTQICMNILYTLDNAIIKDFQFLRAFYMLNISSTFALLISVCIL